MPEEADGGAIRAARPSLDEVARDRALAKVGQRLFGTPSVPHRLGRFVIIERLGGGGMGLVYSAYDPVLDRRVALKLLRPRPGPDAEHMRARLQREAQALARLSHPNVVPVYDVGIIEGEVFIVMEFVVGETLRAWARKRPWHDVMAMYLQAARGLAAAHAVGLVHRDVKPDNVMVGKDGRPRLLDFGLVRDFAAELDTQTAAAGGVAAAPAADDQGTTSADLEGADVVQPGRAGSMARAPVVGRGREELTATNAIMGTLAYMAPEQLASASIGPAADQFSFCVALYEALYGQLPFKVLDLNERPVELRAARALGAAGELHAPFPDPIEPAGTSAVPPALWTIIRRGLARDPGQDREAARSTGHVRDSRGGRRRARAGRNLPAQLRCTERRRERSAATHAARGQHGGPGVRGTTAAGRPGSGSPGPRHRRCAVAKNRGSARGRRARLGR